MSDRKQKPTRWFYLAAILMPFFACVGTGIFVQQRMPNLPGALDAAGIDNLTQVIVPGSEEISFPKAGAYAVYYEYRSAINGVKYVRNEFPPRLNCQLKSKATGKDVEMTRNYIEGNIYSTQNEDRAGVHIMSITIDKPGVHLFSCQFPKDSTSPKLVLAVGPNIIWEFFNLALKPISAVFFGGLMFFCVSGISVLLAGIVAFKRRQRNAEDDTASHTTGDVPKP